jgi:hypothetical protein
VLLDVPSLAELVQLVIAGWQVELGWIVSYRFGGADRDAAAARTTVSLQWMVWG